MRRLLLLAVTALVAVPFYGQDQSTVITEKTRTMHTSDARSAPSYERIGAPEDGDPIVEIFYEDFANGIPAEWVNAGFDGNGQPLPAALWEYRGPNTSPNSDTGSLGAYASVDNLIESPSRPNGFLIFDSDYLDNNGIQGNFGGGPAPAPHVGTLTMDTMDLSAHPNVVLSFNSYHRYFEGRTLIVASGDGGATWGDTTWVHSEVAVNAATDPDERVSVDLSSAIGGSSNALIKFVFDGTYDDPGAQGSGAAYYFWMIDDVRLIEKPKNELALTDYLLSSVPTEGLQIFYGFNPWHQSPEVYALGGLLNQGLYDQDNAGTMLHVYSASQDYTNVSQTMLLQADSFRITDNFIDLSNEPVGLYGMSISAVSDSAYDTDPRGIRPVYDTIASPNITEITDSIYSVDADYRDREMGSEYASGNAQDGARFANALIIKEAAELTAIRINIGPGTLPGGDLLVEVKDTTPTFGTAFDAGLGGDWTNVVVKSEPYRITAEDTANGFVRIPIPEVLSGSTPQDRVLSPDMYFVSVSMFSNSGVNPITIIDDNTSNQGAFATIYYYYPDNRWYTDGNALHIRAVVQKPVGIEEQANIGEVSLHPNPASTHVQLNVEANETANYQVVITNISGKIVKELNFSSTNNIHQNLDVSDLASGIYAVQIKNDAGTATKKLVIGR